MLTVMTALSKVSRGHLTMRNNCVPSIIRHYSSDTSSRLRSTVSSLPLLRLGFENPVFWWDLVYQIKYLGSGCVISGGSDPEILSEHLEPKYIKNR